MTGKRQGISLCLVGALCVLLAIFSDYLANRPLIFGSVQIFLLIIGTAIIGSGILILRGILKLPSFEVFLSTTKPKQAALEVTNPLSYYLIIWGLCLFLSSMYLLICTRSSPLYPLNDWVDANAFFTMGKGMMNGKILYRDLFEHKGPLLYLIHGFAYLIANTSFLGVYIFEALAFSIFLFFCFKSLSLFVDYKYSLIALPLIGTGILNLKSFTYGDSAEELCLPLIMISLFYLINYFKNVYPGPMTNRQFFINGFVAGCVLWIKFSLLGFWFGWMLSMLVCMLINKQYLRALKGCLFFSLGILVTTLPWILYFGINDSINSWLFTYFTYNLTFYQRSKPLIERILYTIIQISGHLKRNPVFSGLLWVGIITFISSRYFIKSLLNRICIFFCLAMLAFGVYGGGRGLVYYFLVVCPFVIFGFIVLLKSASGIFGEIRSAKIFASIIFFLFITTMTFTFLFNQNRYLLKMDKEDLAQYKFASIINESEDSTLLCYGSLDSGFYTTTGITPNVKYFIATNIDYSIYPQMKDEQKRYIKDKVVDYVVIRVFDANNKSYMKIPYFMENYQLLELEKQMQGNDEYYYLLFKKII